MWYGHLARHRQDACATSFTSEMETLYKEDIGFPDIRKMLGFLRQPNLRIKAFFLEGEGIGLRNQVS
jgi:hypothetical protein